MAELENPLKMLKIFKHARDSCSAVALDVSDTVG